MLTFRSGKNKKKYINTCPYIYIERERARDKFSDNWISVSDIVTSKIFVGITQKYYQQYKINEVDLFYLTPQIYC